MGCHTDRGVSLENASMHHSRGHGQTTCFDFSAGGLVDITRQDRRY